MKTIIAAAAIAMAFTTTAQAATPVSDCYTMGESINMLATLRDRGISAGVVFEYLSSENMNEEIVLTLIELVYVVGSTFGPDELEDAYVTDCVKGLV